jgi:hypothetical protein
MTKKKYPLPDQEKKPKSKLKSSKKPKLKEESVIKIETAEDFLLCEEPMAYIAEKKDLVTLEDAAILTDKTVHNIRDYIQRGRIAKRNTEGETIQRADVGELRISLKELRTFLPNSDGLLKAHYRKYDLGL